MKLFKNICYSKAYSNAIFCKDLNFIKVEYNIVSSNIDIFSYDDKPYIIYFYITTLEEVKKLYFRINIDKKDNHKLRKIQTKKDIMRLVDKYIENGGAITTISSYPKTKKEFHILFVDFIYFGSYDF